MPENLEALRKQRNYEGRAVGRQIGDTHQTNCRL